MSDYRKNSKRLTKIISQLRRAHLRFHPSVLLSPGEFMLMDEIVLGSDSKGIKPSELSARLDMGKSAISKVLVALEEKGMTCRSFDPEDRRGVLILPTPAGRNEYKKAIRSIEEMGCRIFERMGEEDSKELLRLMEKFYGIFSEFLSEEEKMR